MRRMVVVVCRVGLDEGGCGWMGGWPCWCETDGGGGVSGGIGRGRLWLDALRAVFTGRRASRP